jgi:hypothetical protein
MSSMGQNPFAAIAAAATASVQSGVNARVEKIFADIDPEQSPLAYGIKDGGTALFDLVDSTVHAIAELEKRLNAA